MRMLICCVILSTFLVYVLQMFRKLRNAYVDMLCNPFYIPGIRGGIKKFVHLHYIFLTA